MKARKILGVNGTARFRVETGTVVVIRPSGVGGHEEVGYDSPGMVEITLDYIRDRKPEMLEADPFPIRVEVYEPEEAWFGMLVVSGLTRAMIDEMGEAIATLRARPDFEGIFREWLRKLMVDRRPSDALLPVGTEAGAACYAAALLTDIWNGHKVRITVPKESE